MARSSRPKTYYCPKPRRGRRKGGRKGAEEEDYLPMSWKSKGGKGKGGRKGGRKGAEEEDYLPMSWKSKGGKGKGGRKGGRKGGPKMALNLGSKKEFAKWGTYALITVGAIAGLIILKQLIR